MNRLTVMLHTRFALRQIISSSCFFLRRDRQSGETELIRSCWCLEKKQYQKSKNSGEHLAMS